MANVIDQVQLPDGKLIKEEEREKGKISKQVYLMYMKACTLPLALMVIFLIVATQAMKMGTDFWLSVWSESSVVPNNTDIDLVDVITESYVLPNTTNLDEVEVIIEEVKII